MSIDPFLTGQAFDSKAIREMSLALESVCNALGVAPDQAARKLVAEKIIELAGHGMRGATLHATAAKAVEPAIGMSNIQNAEATLKCTKCGHFVPPRSESTSDETLIICPACGADLGTWGETKKVLWR
jgi:DNA-directed RNA polymerase subunit RPC12/RpoP